jgi:MFS family permease
MHQIVSNPVDTSRRWWLLAIVVAAQFMFGVDAFIVNVAIPTIASELHTSSAQIEAVIAIYLIASPPCSLFFVNLSFFPIMALFTQNVLPIPPLQAGLVSMSLALTFVIAQWRARKTGADGLLLRRGAGDGAIVHRDRRCWRRLRCRSSPAPLF